jgi:hypothetical protein
VLSQLSNSLLVVHLRCTGDVRRGPLERKPANVGFLIGFLIQPVR